MGNSSKLQPADYGLVYIKGEFKYFTEVKVIKEKMGTKRIKVTLASGETLTHHRYFNKRRGRFIEVEEAIHRYPSDIITTEDLK